MFSKFKDLHDPIFDNSLRVFEAAGGRLPVQSRVTVSSGNGVVVLAVVLSSWLSVPEIQMFAGLRLERR